MNIYEPLTDRLLQCFTTEEFADDVEQGRIVFFEGTGFLDEEAENYNMKMKQFGDWFLFHRPLNAYGRAPVEVCSELDDFEILEEQKVLFNNLKNTRHSLFEFIKFSKEDMHIKDLFSDYKMILKRMPLKYGFNKGDIFEGRLIPHEDNFCFTQSFCFHPEESKKFILKGIKKNKILPIEGQAGAREQFIFKIFKMKNKYEQYAHIAADKIYTDGVGLRI